jgi:V/A-type H+-transporting ATPase subunit I
VLSPAKMVVIKVTTRTSLERKIVRVLHDFTEIELIDVEKKGLGGIKSLESDAEKEIFILLNTASSVIDSLNVPGRMKKTKNHQLEKEKLDDFVKDTQKFLSFIEPEAKTVIGKLSTLNSEITELQGLQETTEILSPLSLEFGDLGEGSYFTVFAGSVKTENVDRLEWNVKELTNDTYFFDTKRIPKSKESSAVVVGVLQDKKDDLARVLSSFLFTEIILPKNVFGNPEQVKKDTHEKIKVKEAELAEWVSQQKNLANQHGETLLATHEQLTIEKERIEAKKLMRQTNYALQFWGFIPKSQKQGTDELIKSIDPEAIIEFDDDPKFKAEDFPTKLENHKYVGKPYEPLVTAFGYPAYKKDYDPSIFFAITFPILFGIMFADIFHGILLLFIGLLGLSIKPLGRAPVTMGEEMKDYVQKGGLILTLSAISSIIFGILFYSFAGLHGTHVPSFMREDGALGFLKDFALFSNDSEPYKAFGNAQGTFLFLQLSLVVGIIHIAIALLLLLIKKVQKNHTKEAILFPGMLLGGYLASVVLIFAYGLDFSKWFSMDQQAFDLAIFPFLGYGTDALIQIPGSLPFTILMLIFFGIFFVNQLTHGMDGFSEALDFLLSLLGNSVSYARLFALNVVHGILSLIVYSALSLDNRLPFDSIAHEVNGGAHAAATAASSTDPAGEFLIIIAFLIGTIIVMTLELIITFLQALRLHLVEFFSKMHFSGSGRPFEAFKAHRSFTEPAPVNTQLNE